jgi:TonB family protein
VELTTATKQYEGQVVGSFPLRQFIGETETGTVFLTQRDNGEKAAIKLVPADAYEATKQLSYWKRAAQLTHPHLLKIFETGRCQLNGRNHVYVVMEYADENLSEILPSRALTPAEVREMLAPLLDCLGYLHGSGFVHGHLRPANIMAANNQLKLSSDGIRQAGEAYPAGRKRSKYDPPEVGTATVSASADVWSLGITLVEVLAQRVPDWENASGEPVVPASLPEPFREIAVNCLKRDPNARATVPQLKGRLNQKQPLPPPPVEAAPPAAHKGRPARKVMPVSLGVALVLAVILGAILFRHKTPTRAGTGSQIAPPKAEQMKEMPARPPAGQPNGNVGVSSNSAGSADVVLQVPPKISPSAQRTIRGRIRLRVRAHVDQAGNVTRADLVSAGPSKYFARAVMDAAREWKFVPSSQPGERRYLLHFDLTRRGNSARAEATR